MPSVAVSIETPDKPTEERVVRAYVVPAMDRAGDYEVTFFGRYADAADVDGGRIDVTLTGNLDTIYEHEKPRWQELTDTLDVDYTVDANDSDDDADRKFPPEQAELLDRLCTLAVQMNQHYFDAFAERPATGSIPDDQFLEVGQWVLVHMLLNEQGYAIQEEIDILMYGLRDRFGRLGKERNLDTVEVAIEETIDRIERTHADLRDRIAD